MIQANKRQVAAVSAAAMALVLGGCQALGIGGHGIARAGLEAERSAIADFGAGQLEEGRKALKEGRTADAIDAFMLAKSFAEEAPAAYNGLAVAYSRLGREDLTERFFRVAIALAPEDTRYRSNLALFYANNGMPRSAGPSLAFEQARPLVDVATPDVQLGNAQVPVEPVTRSLGAGISVRSPVSRLQRVSSSEVTIVSGQASARTVAGASGHRAVIEVGRSASPSASPAARVALASARAVVAPQKDRAYPIRIRLED
ncbi:hypothetical protein N0B51_10405 [Tsuneonella sp. YG55]|uniref:Tetratricopeptide repeat protein n=1 Tax=Tsuneonella litorea TaxID=2976475 RepID=A0A9X2W371_9SPHN|nr:hypothetical protein [Tsuneonella litorea]MCT2559389.1 hypothetical protein [Tsuneonella litorea]